MKAVHLAGALAALACAGTDVPELPIENLGTVEQPIFMPAGYGHEGNSTRCDGSWSGGECQVPDWGDKEFKIKRLLQNCDAWTIDRIDEALTLMQQRLEAVGWTMNLVTSGQNGTISCSTASGPPGTMNANGPWDLHSTSRGTLKQYGGFAITIRQWSTYLCDGTGEPGEVWSNATVQEQVNVFINIITHEISHVVGLGHGAQGTLMAQTMACDTDAPQWQGVLDWEPEEYEMLLCYNPNSGTGSDCQ